MEFETIKNYILNYCYDYLTKKEVRLYWFGTVFVTAISLLMLMFEYPNVYTIDFLLMYLFLTGVFASTVWSAVLFVSKKRRQSIKMHAIFVGSTACLCGLVVLLTVLRSLATSEYSVLLFLPILALTASGGVIAIIRIKQNVAASLVCDESSTDSATASKKGITPGTIGGIFGMLGFLLVPVLFPQDMYLYLLFYIGVLISVFFSFGSCVHFYRLHLIQKYCPQIDDYAGEVNKQSTEVAPQVSGRKNKRKKK